MGTRIGGIAVLDACVLFPIAICDALLSVARERVYEPKWTARIDDEWLRALERLHGIAPGVVKRRDIMREAFPRWQVPREAWQPLEHQLRLPDCNDRHVLAAGIAAHADCIVTFNLKDFPREVLSPLGIEAVHPDDFLVSMWDLDAAGVIRAAARMRGRRRRPGMSPSEFGEALGRSGLPSFAKRLSAVLHLI